MPSNWNIAQTNAAAPHNMAVNGSVVTVTTNNYDRVFAVGQNCSNIYLSYIDGNIPGNSFSYWDDKGIINHEMGNTCSTAFDIKSATSSNGAYVAVGSGGAIQLNGQAVISGTNNELRKVIYDSVGNRFIAVGANNTILTSPDGSSWTHLHVSGTANNIAINDIACGTNQCVAVGDSEEVLIASRAHPFTQATIQ